MNTRILVDMDGILADFFPKLAEKYNEITGEGVKEEDVKDYSFSTSLKQPSLAIDIFENDGFFSELDPVPGALTYFNRMIKEGFDITVVTQLPRKSKTAAFDKRDWIKTYFPDFDLVNVIFAHKKNMVNGEVLFDDNPHHLISWKKEHILGRTCKIVYPFNKSCDTDYSFSKNTAWREFYELCKYGPIYY